MRLGPCSASTLSVGAKRSASIDQFGIRLVGQTISAGWSNRPAVLLDQQMRKRLHGLAQTHVVGEDAAKIRAAQELQPVDAARLILAQRTMKRIRNDRVRDRAARITQLPAKRTQRLAALQVKPGTFLQLCEIGGIQTGKPDPFTVDAKPAAA